MVTMEDTQPMFEDDEEDTQSQYRHDELDLQIQVEQINMLSNDISGNLMRDIEHLRARSDDQNPTDEGHFGHGEPYNLVKLT